MICLQTLHGSLKMLANLPVHIAAQADPQEQLCGDDHVLPNVLERLADDQLVMPDAGKAGAVDLRCIEEGAAVLIAIADGLDAVLFRRNLAVAVGKGHAAHAHLGNGQVVQLSCLHF